jgi:hypothetical protein
MTFGRTLLLAITTMIAVERTAVGHKKESSLAVGAGSGIGHDAVCNQVME